MIDFCDDLSVIRPGLLILNLGLFFSSAPEIFQPFSGLWIDYWISVAGFTGPAASPAIAVQIRVFQLLIGLKIIQVPRSISGHSFFCIVGETHARSKETFILCYFSILKFKALRVPEESAVCSPAIVGNISNISVNHNIFQIKLFGILSIWPALFLVNLQTNMIIASRAGESEPVSENLFQDMPILFLISGIILFDDLFMVHTGW
jgi:hypothetical protein